MISTIHHRNWARIPIDHKDPSLVLYLPLWYPYSDVSGGTIYSYDRSRTSCAVTGATLVRQARNFAGGDDYIEFTQSALDFGASDFTLVAWVRRAVGDLRTLICHGADSVKGFRWRYSGADRFVLATSQAAAIQVTEASTSLLVLNVWAQVGMVRVGADVTPYFNGVVDSIFSAGTHINPTNVAGATQIGLYSDYISDPWYGDIGEILVYNRAWSAGEFLRYYQRTKWRYL